MSLALFVHSPCIHILNSQTSTPLLPSYLLLSPLSVFLLGSFLDSNESPCLAPQVANPGTTDQRAGASTPTPCSGVWDRLPAPPQREWPGEAGVSSRWQTTCRASLVATHVCVSSRVLGAVVTLMQGMAGSPNSLCKAQEGHSPFRY